MDWIQFICRACYFPRGPGKEEVGESLVRKVLVYGVDLIASAQDDQGSKAKQGQPRPDRSVNWMESPFPRELGSLSSPEASKTDKFGITSRYKVSLFAFDNVKAPSIFQYSKAKKERKFNIPSIGAEISGIFWSCPYL